MLRLPKLVCLEPVPQRHAAAPEACVPGACAPEKPPQGEARAPQRRAASARCTGRKPAHSSEDPEQPKNEEREANEIIYLLKKFLFSIL